jgi:hypothetical protein
VIRVIRNRLVEHPSADWAIVACLVGAHISIVWSSGRADWLRTTGFANRLSVYTDLITVTGIFAGFTIAALASYLGFSGAQIEALRQAAGEKILKQWLAAISGPALAIGTLVACKIVDRADGTAQGARWAAEIAMGLTATRILRLFYIFIRLMQIATAPRKAEQQVPLRALRTMPPGSSPRS